MTSQTVTKTESQASLTPEGGAVVPDGVAQALVTAAREQGVALTGPGGLLSGLTRQVLESALEAELTAHLGHSPGEAAVGGNVRNGYTSKTVRTEIGDVAIRVPRDRAGVVRTGDRSQAFTTVDRFRRRRDQLVCEGYDDR